MDTDLKTDHGDWIAGAGIIDPSFIGTIGYRHRFDVRFTSRNEKAPVDAFVLVGDLDQRYRSPISPKTVPPGSGWIVEQRGDLEREASFGGSWQVMRLGNLRVLTRHWYEGTEGMGSEIFRGLLAFDSSPWHRPSDVMVVRLTTEVVGATSGALENAQARLDRFETALDADLSAVRVKTRRALLPRAEVD